VRVKGHVGSVATIFQIIRRELVGKTAVPVGHGLSIVAVAEGGAPPSPEQLAITSAKRVS
jgi:hypothetical protein